MTIEIEARSQEPEARSQEPGARSQKPGMESIETRYPFTRLFSPSALVRLSAIRLSAHVEAHAEVCLLPSNNPQLLWLN